MANELASAAVHVGDPDDGDIDLREVFDLLKAGRWTIFVFLVAFLLAGVFYIAFANPVFDVNGIVQVEQENKVGGLSSELGSLGSLLGGAPVQADAEIEIIQSRLVLEKTIHQLNLLVEAEPNYLPLIGRAIAHWNRGAKQPVRSPPLLGRFAWGGESIDVSKFNVPQQLKDKTWQLTAMSGEMYSLESPGGDYVLKGKIGQEAFANTQFGTVTLLVDSLIARPGETFELRRRAIQTVLKDMRAHLSVSELGSIGIGKSSGVIQIAYSGHDKNLIANILDSIESVYLGQNIKQQTVKAQQSLQFLESQLPELKSKVDTAQAELARYQKSNGAANVSMQTDLLLKQSVSLETERSSLIQQREQALQRFTPAHPVVRGLDEQIATIERDQAQLHKKISKLPNTQQDVLSLMRDLDVSTQLYATMLDAIQQFQVTKAGTVGNVRIVDKALEPLIPTSPKKALSLILAALMGIFFGVAYVFIRRALLRGVDDPALIERQFGISVLSSIPYASEQKKLARAVRRMEPGSHVLATLQNDSIAVEALRSLRTSLHFSMLDAPNNVIMLTGPAPGIGKSFVSVNLAALLALTGKRVVVVDVDLRKGHVNKYFGLSEQPGVSEYIADGLAISLIVKSTNIASLDFIPRGSHPPNAAELVANDRFDELVQDLSASYDYVILDTPPILAVTDAAIIGKLAATTLMVLKSAEHPIREIDDSIKRLATVGVHVRGFVINQVGAKAGAYGYGAYGYSQYKYE